MLADNGFGHANLRKSRNRVRGRPGCRRASGMSAFGETRFPRVYLGTDGGMYDEREARLLRTFGTVKVIGGPLSATPSACRERQAS